MIGLGDYPVTILVLKFEVVRKQFIQIFAVIVIVAMDVIQEVNKPFAEVHFAYLATAEHGIHDCCIFGGIMISTEQPVLPA